MAQLRREVETIRSLGAELVVVGNGTAAFANAFRGDLELDIPLYIDAACESYRALGMRRGIARTLGWRSLARMVGVIYEHPLRRLPTVLRWWYDAIPALKPGDHGDAWQLGGVLIVHPGGDVALRYLSAFAGDHPSVATLLGALAPEIT